MALVPAVWLQLVEFDWRSVPRSGYFLPLAVRLTEFQGAWQAQAGPVTDLFDLVLKDSFIWPTWQT